MFIAWQYGPPLFTPNVKSELIENLGGILGGTQCSTGDYLILSER